MGFYHEGAIAPSFSSSGLGYFMPMRFRIMAAGQKPVNALCIRLTPTKTLSQTKPGWTQAVSSSDSSKMQPCHVSLLFFGYLVVANLVLIYTID